jgi:hypothetical protein
MVKFTREYYQKISRIGLKKRWDKERKKVRIRNKLSLEKAGINAYLCGDGHIKFRKDNRGYPHYDIRIYPDNEELAKFIVSLFKKEFNIEPHIKNLGKYFRVEIGNKLAFENLIKIGKYSTKEWHIPKSITNNSLREWLRCFFDCESNVDLISKCIALKSVNFNGLLDVKEKLKLFKIESKVYGPYQPKNQLHSPYGILFIKGENILRYKKFINFHHPLKRAKLEKF